MSAWRSFRVLAGTGLLIAGALASSWQSLRQDTPLLLAQHFPRDVVSGNEVYLAALRAALPTHGVVGYLASVPLQKAPRSTLAVAQFYSTQYSLAPLIVVNDPSQRLVVANLPTGSVAEAIANHPQLVVVRDFGRGVALLRWKES